MNDFDLIIVGAGPGGSNAAAVALDDGLGVVQIDGACFPRVKPCAGGVTLKAATSLRYPLAPSVCRSFNTIEFNLWNRHRNRFTHPGTVLYTVCRPNFDNRLVSANLSRPNFTFMDGRRVTGVEYDRRFVVKTDAGTLTAPQLIGADGAHSIVNRTFRISRPRALATAVEINIPCSGIATLADSVPCFDYGALPQGYGWVFPKGDHWSVGFEGRTVHVRDLKGMRYLAQLLFHPGREFHVLDMVAAETGQRTALGDAGEILDERAKTAYRRRLAEIEEDIQQARALEDTSREAQADTERDFLVRELASAVGLGGRHRRAASDSERARSGVTRAVRQAIARIGEHHPRLGEHLTRSIRTGTHCAYVPDPRAPAPWRS